MPELSFRVRGARGVPFAAAPAMGVALEVTNRVEGEAVQSVLLQAQVRIEAPLRSYSPGEQEALRELFGAPERWSRTLRGVLWAQATTVVRPFTGVGEAELILPCPLDFTSAAAKYFHALETGHVPLLLLFSGTVFYTNDAGALQAAPVPWSAEAGFLLPVSLWQGLLEHHFPHHAPLSLRRELFERLYRYQVSEGLANLDQAVESLLGRAPPTAARSA